MEYLLFLIFSLILTTTTATFNEESIFEDEDIYSQALPPVPHTGITAPGTKWCGPGNTANNYNDLGTAREADICCRAHDHCEEIIETQQTLHELHNPDWFPRLKCTCEQEFINCLQKANTITANTLGRVYFGTRSVCFGFSYPNVRCKVYQEGTFRKRCIRYEVDKTKPKIWQFYDIPFYSIKPNSMGRTMQYV